MRAGLALLSAAVIACSSYITKYDGVKLSEPIKVTDAQRTTSISSAKFSDIVIAGNATGCNSVIYIVSPAQSSKPQATISLRVFANSK